jgi:hypothetical protein
MVRVHVAGPGGPHHRCRVDRHPGRNAWHAPVGPDRVVPASQWADRRPGRGAACRPRPPRDDDSAVRPSARTWRTGSPDALGLPARRGGRVRCVSSELIGCRWSLRGRRVAGGGSWLRGDDREEVTVPRHIPSQQAPHVALFIDLPGQRPSIAAWYGNLACRCRCLRLERSPGGIAARPPGAAHREGQIVFPGTRHIRPDKRALPLVSGASYGAGGGSPAAERFRWVAIRRASRPTRQRFLSSVAMAAQTGGAA